MQSDEWKKLKKYSGQWVALKRNKIVGHGKTLKEAYNKGLKFCREPKVFQVPENANEVYLL
ncbi:hypothetical protein KKG83_04840 [Candidatus Micrarchaeota archaeon]|nr:hypothetical protein [Candidatus Micrarchaeota archaeon]MBU2476772.1 hypothetical protein [Candidatus Micrarchaeota archaeon]